MQHIFQRPKLIEAGLGCVSSISGVFLGLMSLWTSTKEYLKKLEKQRQTIYMSEFIFIETNKWYLFIFIFDNRVIYIYIYIYMCVCVCVCVGNFILIKSYGCKVPSPHG
jgi:uncharacterized membrane protein SpoIIM required for sporulation